MESIEIYCVTRVAYLYQNVAIVEQFYEKKRLKYFVYVNRISRWENIMKSYGMLTISLIFKVIFVRFLECF